MLQQYFRPEFLNRIDEIITFKQLGAGELGKILDIQLARLAERLAERKITLKLTDAARRFLIERGTDVQFGARPLKRAIQTELENPLARAILAGTGAAQGEVAVDVQDGKLAFGR
jgi:ATP-dependent Clp protease ATP-binding subunit ClpB